MPSILKLTALATLVGTSHAAPVASTSGHEELRRFQTQNEHPADGDPAMVGGGYMGGPAVYKPDKPGEAAPWPEFVAESVVTSGKYSVAGFESGADLATMGLGQKTGNPLINTFNRFNELGKDTTEDYSNLQQGGTINPIVQYMREQEDGKSPKNAPQGQEAIESGLGGSSAENMDGRRELQVIKKKPTFGEALNNVGESFNNDAALTLNSINPFAGEPEHDRARIKVTPHSEGCGNTKDESSLIRPFFVDSAKDPSTFHWCPSSGCDEALVLGGDTLHYDFGMVKLRGCPLHEGYTIPYLRLMQVLLGSYNTLYLGWGACDQGETHCAIGNDVHLKPGDCKTLMHPLKPEQTYDVCFIGPA